MRNKLAQLVMLSQHVNRQHVQLIFAAMAIAMLVLGAGAPSDGGGAGRRALMSVLHHHSP